MLVFILNKEGKPLMPCSPSKARKLLKEEKAKVVLRTPFTIQLLYGSSGYKQKIKLGTDGGYKHVGLSAVTEKKELYSADVQLRTDIVDLNSERASYRRTRRNRKTWYRKPRFLNRTKSKKKGWFAPSLENKIQTHIKLIDLVHKILPITETCVEVANFDIQKIKNPEIQGTEYQEGEQNNFWNVREYILHRDEHKCRFCLGKSKDNILNVHHLESRKVGGDRPDNLITLCQTCHIGYHQKTLKIDFKKITKKGAALAGFKAETFMTAVRWRIIHLLKEKYGENIIFTYGYKTKQKRIESKITKSHINDAFVIADGSTEKRSPPYFIKQVRRSNRKLFKGDRSHLPNLAPRFIKGFQRYDKVLFKKKECFIFGRRTSGYFDLRSLNGEKVHASAKIKDLILKESFKSLLIERTKDFDSSASILPKDILFPPCPKGQDIQRISR
jgi:5-methylcytosine-specific restriction endonuclease McrA